jgi:hypothetical protein
MKVAIIAHSGITAWGLPERFPEIEFEFSDKGRGVNGVYHHVIALRGGGITRKDTDYVQSKFGKGSVRVMSFSKVGVTKLLEGQLANHLAKNLNGLNGHH